MRFQKLHLSSFKSLQKIVAKINHKNFLKNGGKVMLSNLINDEVYDQALNVAKQNEIDNELSGLLNSLTNLSNTLSPQEEINIEVKDKDEKNLKTADAEVNIEFNNPEPPVEMKWTEGAMQLQNKNMLEKNEYERFNQINEKLTNDLNGIYVESQTLSNAREEALKNFDIGEVVRIDERLKQLQTLYGKKLAEAETHKKDIVSYEQDYTAKYKELEDSFEKANFNNQTISVNKNHFGKKVLNDFLNDKTVEIVKSFLSNYPKSTCKEILQKSPELISKLGKNYSILLKEYE